MKDFRKLKIWEKSHQLCLRIYEATARFPKEEIFGLTSQIRRSCVSIAANIAEGCGRNSENELGHFLDIAMGSASELECLILLAKDLDYFKAKDSDELLMSVIEIKRMLGGFIHRLRKN